MKGSLPGPDRVVRLAAEHAPRVVDALAEAFRDYPVMRYFLGNGTPDYDARLRKAIDFFVASRVLRNEPLLGIEVGPALGAAAIVTIPDGRVSPPEVGERREALWAELGAETRARYDACSKVWEKFAVDVPHIHLNMIGVRASLARRGLGRVLLEHVQEVARRTPKVQGVTLTTEDPRNVPLYEHVGYEVADHAKIAPDLETWWMFRRI